MTIEKFESWKILKDKIDSLQKDTMIWRGHSLSSWKLESSIYRYFNNQQIKKEIRIQAEQDSIDNFRLLYKFENQDQHFSRNIIETLVLMQHYGCPTRLIDWSFSPYIALYFCLPDMSDEASLYGFNVYKYLTDIKNNYDYLKNDKSEMIQQIPDDLFLKMIKDDNFKVPIPYRPIPLIKRNFIQQSIFLIDMDITNVAEDFINTNFNKYFVKFNFPKSQQSIIFNDLSSMNIDGYHLFQSFEGIARRSKEYLFNGVPINSPIVDWLYW